MLSAETRGRLAEAGRLLVCQERAQVLVQPRAAERGFWFGAGNICRDAPGIASASRETWRRHADGSLVLCGRYRNGGDARAGIAAGPRGAELALFRSRDGGASFGHVLSLLKRDVSPDGEEVLSIEGACLRRTGEGVELYVSSEKRRQYPAEVRDFQKPGTGVWSIDVMSARTVEALAGAEVRPVLRSEEPAWLHLKDPVVFDMGGRAWMIYCAHPFNWTSSNVGLAQRRPDGSFADCARSILPRGPAWDVAVCRVTARLALPGAGVLARGPAVSLYFYDGAECMHEHGAGGRPRGYSCEELGGLAAGMDAEFPGLERLSEGSPLFVSPRGTGCSRYVSVFEGDDAYLVTWQQSQADGSQPLVINRVPKAELARLLRT